MVYAFIEKHWVKIVISLIIIAMSLIIFIQNGRIDKRDDNIAKLNAEFKLGELQQEALRKAILDQSDAVEKQRIDAEKRAAKFEEESKQIWSDFERTKSEVQNLYGDVECEAMRKIVREAVR